MKLFLYANFNRLGGFFAAPDFMSITPEDMRKDYGQLICDLDNETLERISECDLYCLGFLDNVTGEFTSSKDFILHIEEVSRLYLKEKEGEVDGSKD